MCAGVLRAGTSVKHAEIKAHRDFFDLSEMCIVLEVSIADYLMNTYSGYDA